LYKKRGKSKNIVEAEPIISKPISLFPNPIFSKVLVYKMKKIKMAIRRKIGNTIERNISISTNLIADKLKNSLVFYLIIAPARNANKPKTMASSVNFLHFSYFDLCNK